MKRSIDVLIPLFLLLLLICRADCAVGPPGAVIKCNGIPLSSVLRGDPDYLADSKVFTRLLKQGRYVEIQYKDLLSLTFPAQVDHAVIYDRVLQSDGSPLYKYIADKKLTLRDTHTAQYIIEPHISLLFSSQRPNPYIESPRGLKIDFEANGKRYCQFLVIIPRVGDIQDNPLGLLYR